MVFELTASELVVFYRYDEQTGGLELVSESTQGHLPEGLKIPSAIAKGVGVVGLAVQDQELYRADDYRGPDWDGVRSNLQRHLPQGPERRFSEWVGCLIAAPVVANSFTQGAIVAIGSIPSWLNTDDESVVRELALKTGLWLAAKDLTRRLNWHERTKIALNEITAGMARVSDVNTLYRQYLLAVTTDECLGFNRAILFCRDELNGGCFVGCEAVGQRSLEAAKERWKEVEGASLSQKMAACTRRSHARQGDLGEIVSQLTLDLNDRPDVLGAFLTRRTVVRRRDETHLIPAEILAELAAIGGDHEPGYVLVPLWRRGALIGVVFADRAFSEPSDISDARLELLELLTGEFVLMLEALSLRQEEHRQSIAEKLALGVSYAFRTRSAALGARISNIAYKLRAEYPNEIFELEKAVRFFKRAGTLTGKVLRLEELGVGRRQILNVSHLLSETIDYLHDSRIDLSSADSSVQVLADRESVKDVFLEILTNSCDFTDKAEGRVEVRVSAESGLAKIEFIDNGQGIRPDFRPRLFERFQCDPASRVGLGLSYAKSLVAACGGSIREIGKHGHGAHFVVRIPLAEEVSHD